VPFDDDDDDAVFLADASAGEVDEVCAAAVQSAKRQAPLGFWEIVLDSACTRHLVNDRSLLQDVKQLQTPIPLRVADCGTLLLREVGRCVIRLPMADGRWRSITLEGVAFHESLYCNLMSLHRIISAGYSVAFEADMAVVRSNATGREVLNVPCRDKAGLYVLHVPASGANNSSAASDAAFVAQPQAVMALPVPLQQQPVSAVVLRGGAVQPQQSAAGVRATPAAGASQSL